MRNLIVTSNKYSFCLEGFQKQANKYWGGNKFTILGFKEPDVALGENFKYETLGEEFSDNTIWRDALNPYFQNMEDDFFFLAFEDHFLIDNVNVEDFNRAVEIMKNDPTIGKVRLLPKYNFTDNGRVNYNNLEEYDEVFYKAPKVAGIHMQSSLRPSIWRKDFFLKQLNQAAIVRNPHEFEIKNNGTVFTETVLLPKDGYPIYPDIDAMRGGGPNTVTTTHGHKPMNYYNLTLREEDLQVFVDVKNKWQNR